MEWATIFKYFWLILALLSISHVSYIQSENVEPSDELIFAHILFRHGDRNIHTTYPNDPYKDEIFWPGGLGALTNLGKQQQYKLGEYLRQRYFKLMNNGTYHPNNIYVRSTDVNRTLMSTAYTLAGMFPPMNEHGQIWNESLIWQAIPIHTVPEKLDHILAWKRMCPLYEQALSEYEQSPEIMLMMKNNRSIIEYFETNLGRKVSSVCQIKTMYLVLWVEHLKNLTLPPWTEKVFYPGSDIEKLAKFCNAIMVNTKLLARLKAGFLIREILERFTMKKDSTLSPDRSIFMYCAHDYALGNILTALGLTEPHLIGYSSSIMFELHKFNGTFHVEIYYKRDHDHGVGKVPLEPLFIPNCGQKCPLSRMFELFEDIIPTEDFEIECRLPSVSESETVPKSSGAGQSHFSWVSIIMGLLSLRLFI